MLINKTDKLNCENLIKLLNRSKIELDGAREILGAAEVLRWLGGLSTRIEKDIKDQEMVQKTNESIVSAKTIDSLSSDKKSKSKKGE